MKILIDLQSMQSDSALGGIGRYSESLAKELIKLGDEHEYHISLNDSLDIHPNKVRESFAGLVSQANFHVFSPPSILNDYDNPTESLIRYSERIWDLFVESIDPDLLLITSLFEGLNNPYVVSTASTVTTVVILYDLIPLSMKEMYLLDPRTAKHYMRRLDQLRRADALLSISNYSQLEYHRHFQEDNKYILNISSGASNFFRPINLSNNQRDKVYDSLNLDRSLDIILFVGRFDARKNHINLIQAFLLLPQNIRKKCALVIVGNGNSHIYNHLLELAGLPDIEQAGANNIIFTGIVSDDFLLDMYNVSHLLVFPSLAEGFGLPVIEANRCGLPVIASIGTSLDEAVSCPEAQFNPYSSKSISDKIRQVLNDQDFYLMLKEHALINSKKYTWQSSAKRVLFAFSEIVAHRRRDVAERCVPKNSLMSLAVKTYDYLQGRKATLSSGDVQLLTSSFCSLASTHLPFRLVNCLGKKMAMVSTFNVKCGIASFSRSIYESLQKDVKLALFSNYIIDGQALDSNFEKTIQRCFCLGMDDLTSLLDSIISSSADSVYLVYQHGFFEDEALISLIENLIESGLVVVIEMHKCRLPEGLLDQRLADALKSCDLVLCHSRQAIEDLEKVGVYDNVLYNPLHLPPNADISTSESLDSVQCIDLADPIVRIATFGFFLPHKGILELLKIFEAIYRQDNNIRLSIVGSTYPGSSESEMLLMNIEDYISDHSLSGCVDIVSHYLSDQQIVDTLAQADLIFLNYGQTQESASASMRHALLSRKELLLTDIPIFQEARIFTELCNPNDDEAKSLILKQKISSIRRQRAGNPSQRSLQLSRLRHRFVETIRLRSYAFLLSKSLSSSFLARYKAVLWEEPGYSTSFEKISKVNGYSSKATSSRPRWTDLNRKATNMFQGRLL